MSRNTLYELAADLNEVLAKLETAAESDGEIPESLEAELDAIGENFASRVDGVLRARVNKIASAEGLDVEIKRLTALRDQFTRQADWLKGYVFRCMLATGQKELQTKLFKVWIQKNGQPSVKIADGDPIPNEFAKTVTTVSLDSKAVLDRWKELRDAVEAMERHDKAAGLEGDAGARESHMQAAEAFRDEIKRLSLPPSITVIQSSHLRIR